MTGLEKVTSETTSYDWLLLNKRIYSKSNIIKGTWTGWKRADTNYKSINLETSKDDPNHSVY